MRDLVPAALLAVAALAVGPAYAACTYPRAPVSLPNGSTATMEEMIEAQKQVKQYMADMDAYLKCIDDEAPKPPADAQVTEDQKKELARAESMRAQKHNAAVSEMEAVADRFNQQLKAFKEKQKK
jgi:hypothetical protein